MGHHVHPSTCSTCSPELTIDHPLRLIGPKHLWKLDFSEWNPDVISGSPFPVENSRMCQREPASAGGEHGLAGINVSVDEGSKFVGEHEGRWIGATD